MPKLVRLRGRAALPRPAQRPLPRPECPRAGNPELTSAAEKVLEAYCALIIEVFDLQ